VRQALGMSGLPILPYNGLYSLGMCFETYELFISLIFRFFFGHGKPQILKQRTQGHAYTFKKLIWKLSAVK
jgi:hypothetical protein